MEKIELLAPAGDLDRLKLALIYGADAVYIGGKEFSLRSHASNFTLRDIKKACLFAHKLNKKVHVTCNIVMHNQNVKHIKEYLLSLERCGVDAIITSSLYMAKIAKENTKLEIHISTQLSSLNSEAVEFMSHYATRVVLGRECSLLEINKICKNSNIEIETFIHGGMCSSYSGKCMLSNVMTSRDANRGGCAHSCRWKYHLYENNKAISDEKHYFTMSSKDLCGLEFIPQLIEAGVASLKIEGRMKSSNYLCAVISAYRHCIDDYYGKETLNFTKYYELLSLGENRSTGIGFFNGNVTINEQQLELNDKFLNAGDFIGIVRSYNAKTKYATIELKNKILKGETYLKLSPNSDIEIVKVEDIKYLDKCYEIYTIAGHLIKVQLDKPVKPYDIIHKKKVS